MLQNPFSSCAVYTLGLEVDEEEMVVSATRHDRVAQLGEAVTHSLAVTQDLGLVCLELGCLGLLESDSKRGNGVVVWPALQSREHREVDLILQVVVDRCT